MVTDELYTAIASSPITHARHVSATTIAQRRSTRSAITPPNTPKSSHGIPRATWTIEIDSGSDVSDSARRGSPTRTTPSPRNEIVAATHTRPNADPSWFALPPLTGLERLLA